MGASPVRQKKIMVPVRLALDRQLTPAARTVYLVLWTFPKLKRAGELSIVTALKNIVESSNLSENTVTKALNVLEEAGWIRRERFPGQPNRYIFTDPEPEENQAGEGSPDRSLSRSVEQPTLFFG